MVPRVSVIVPVYRVEDRIRRCVDSIINQSLRDIEIILVDDGSPDRSGIICDEYADGDDRVNVIHKEDGGVSSARNAGLRVAKGEYIGFVDSDDYVQHNMFEVMYNIGVKEKVDVVNCGVFFENSSGLEKGTTQFEKNKVLTHSDLMDCLQHLENRLEDVYYCWRNIYRRKVIEDIAITFDESVKYGEDTNFNLLVYSHANSFYAVDQPLYHYVENPSGMMLTKYKERYLELLSMTHYRRLAICDSIGLSHEQNLRGLSIIAIERFLLMLLFNAWESPDNGFVNQIREICNSKMVSESFIHYKPTGKLSKSMQLIIYMLKYRMYLLVRVILAVRFLRWKK